MSRASTSKAQILNVSSSVQCVVTLAWAVFVASTTIAQEFNVQEFDPASSGPWSDATRTTAIVPQVSIGSVMLDGMVSDEEYGGFSAVPVVPGDALHGGWILDQPEMRSWDGPDDSSFSFWLAHDQEYLYVGAQAKDDVVHLGDDGGAFSNDDSLSIVIDALNSRYDEDAGTPDAGLGGFVSVAFDGQISAYDLAGKAPAEAQTTFFPSAGWEFGQDKDIYSVGGVVEGGWAVEVQIRKALMEDPAAGNQLADDYMMGFNIGLGDNDNADVETSHELEYWWSNRNRFLEWDPGEADFYTEDAIAESLQAIRDGADALGDLGEFLDKAIDADGRLRGGGAGEIVFTGGVDPLDCNGDGEVNSGDLSCVTLETIEPTLTRLNLIRGDFNGDKSVNFPDFLILSLNFGKSDVGYVGGDGNLDGSVNFPDFLTLSLNFGKSSEAATSVPEPCSALMIGTLFVGLGVLRRRC